MIDNSNNKNNQSTNKKYKTENEQKLSEKLMMKN